MCSVTVSPRGLDGHAEGRGVAFAPLRPPIAVISLRRVDGFVEGRRAALALGPPFAFPSEGGLVQFASGLLLSPDGGDLLVAFGEQDCEARHASVPLAAVLADLRG